MPALKKLPPHIWQANKKILEQPSVHSQDKNIHLPNFFPEGFILIWFGDKANLHLYCNSNIHSRLYAQVDVKLREQY